MASKTTRKRKGQHERPTIDPDNPNRIVWPGFKAKLDRAIGLIEIVDTSTRSPKPPSTGAQRAKRGGATAKASGGRKKAGRKRIERVTGLGARIDAKGWRGVAMTLTDSGTVAIAGPGHKKASHTLQELGLAEATGRLFVFLAQGEGQYNAFNEAEYGSNPGLLKRHVSRLNKALRDAFGLPGNPVTCKDGTVSTAFHVNTECVLPSPEDEDADTDTIRALFSDVRPQ